MKRTLIVIIVFIIVGWIVGTRFSLFSQNENNSSKNNLEIAQSSPTPTPCVANPETISIPSIGVHSPIEDVGLDSQKRMDVPKNVMDTAWYDLGPRPGQQGSSVIDGHLDTQTGTPAVFWNVGKMKPGDTIEIEDFCGTKTFSVTKVTAYPYDTFPIKTVFGDTSGKYLNLITCGGTWDKSIHLYTKRTVVFSKLVN